jgi:hypothetical protein
VHVLHTFFFNVTIHTLFLVVIKEEMIMYSQEELRLRFQRVEKQKKEYREIEAHGGDRQAFVLGRTPTPALNVLATIAAAAAPVLVGPGSTRTPEELHALYLKVEAERKERAIEARIAGQRARGYRV